MPSTIWTFRRFFYSGDDYFAEMIGQIRKAQKQIHVETYIFEWDRLTKVLMEELKQARDRGCTVRMLVDGFGSYYWLNTLANVCRRDGIELRVWEPLPRGFLSLQVMLRSAGFRLFRLLRRWNRRDHRKITLIDGRVVFLGSMNWTQVHSEKIMGARSWRDAGVMLEGPAVGTIERSLALTWRNSRRGKFRPLLLPRRLRDRRYDPSLSPVRLNQSRRDRRFLARNLIHRIRAAKTRILIESAYFLPTRAVVVALRRAARRGVRVEVIIPGVSDVPLVKWAASGLSRVLLKAGVRVFEYQPRILHAKYMVIDEWAAVGSSNFNHRSLFHDLEIEATFTEPDAVEELARQWEQDRRVSAPLVAQILSHKRLRRWLENLAFRLRYFL